MDTSTIFKFIFFIVLFGLFFSYSLTTDIFTKMTEKINLMNSEFFSHLSTNILFLFVFLVFILIFAVVLATRK